MIDAKRLYRMARHIAYTKARHECPEQVAQDLQQAAWLRYFKVGEHAYIWRDMEYAMLEELSRWNWSCARGRGTNRVLKLKSSLKAWKSPINTLDPERLMILREEAAAVVVNRGGRPSVAFCKRGHPSAGNRTARRACRVCEKERAAKRALR